MTRLSNWFTAVSCAAIATTPLVAHAEVEIGGTAGLHIFSKNNELGVDDVPSAPSASNSLLLGLRIGAYFGHVIGVEGELGFIPTSARDLDYGVTALTYRGHLVAQFLADKPESKVIPFLLVGAGAFSTVSTDNDGFTGDPNMNLYKDTDSAFYFGLGSKFRLGASWGLRLDGRMLLVPSSENDTPPSEDTKKIASDFEVLASAYLSFGGPKKEEAPPPPPVDDDPDKDGIRGAADQCPQDPEDKDAFQDEDGCSEPDNDSDGILDAADKCPTEPEDKDAFQDEDGCPDPDNDADGILDGQDMCPGDPEDKDGFKDEDGCPDPDNDADGVLDPADKCPAEPETKNGFQDEDGCPDEIPEKLKKFTGAIQGINFRTGSADLLPTSNRTLDKAVAVLNEFKDSKMEIQGHTDDVALKPKKGSKFADNLELSQGRAESVREYFIKKGIAPERLSAKGYGDTVPAVDPNGLKGGKLKTARAKNRRVEFKLVSPLEGTAPAAPAPTP